MTREPSFVVRHSGGECRGWVARGLLAELPSLLERECPGLRPLVISDDRVAAAVPSPLDAPRLTFPAGEASKTRETWARLTDAMAGAGFGRDTVVVALGGGVTGDLAGFVAATWHRGVPFVQAPTSVLAMVDAAIGGKTGIDTPAGKNLVGAFHQPVMIVADPAVLDSLPADERHLGLAEVVKHAVVSDGEHLEWLSRHARELADGDPDLTEAAVRWSARLKADVVSADERERGRRAILNAGHTVGHALEAASGFSIRHGEAVAIGLVVEATLAERLGVALTGTANPIRTCLERLGLPTTLPRAIPVGGILDAMRRDKKNRGGRIRCSLIAGIGRPVNGWTVEVDEGALAEVLG